ncbi:FlaD/FlaE family flagellar protein [Candidatus Altiarchaeota archaeon]
MDRLIKELFDGVKSRLKNVGETTADGQAPSAETQVNQLPLDAPQAPSPDAGTPGEEVLEDFSALLETNDTSEIEGKIKDLEMKTQKLESTVKQTLDIAKGNSDRLDSIDNNMKKFLSLYELVTNQINPFVENEKAPIKKMLTVDGQAIPEVEEERIIVPPASELEQQPVEEQIPSEPQPIEQLIQPQTPAPQQAGAGQPEQIMFMQSIKNGTASFVLEWITSLIGEKGSIERNTQLLRYLLNLGWITPKAYDSILKHLESLLASSQPIEEKKLLEQMIPLTIGVPTQGIPQPRSPYAPIQDEQASMQENMQQLMSVLDWIKYLVNNVGIDDTEEIMKYLVDLDWLTPEAHKALINYINNTRQNAGQVSPPTDAIQRVAEKMGMKTQQQVAPIGLPQARVNAIPQPPQPVAAPQAPQGMPKIMPPPSRQPIPQPAQVQQPQARMAPQAAPGQQAPKAPAEGFKMPPFGKQEKKVRLEDIIPLSVLEDDNDSLAVIVEWIRYFMDKAGADRSLEIFDYYHQVGWIASDVKDVIDSYIESIRKPDEQPSQYQPGMDDHAATLFFITRLRKMEYSEDDIRRTLTG